MKTKKESISTHKTTKIQLKSPFSDDLIWRIFEKTDFSKGKGKDKQDTSIFESIQNQRHCQRNVVFWFSLSVAGGSIFAIFVLIGFQAFERLTGFPRFSILDNHQLEIISTGVLLEVFGIIAIITRAIWNDGSYSELLARDFSRRENKTITTKE